MKVIWTGTDSLFLVKFLKQLPWYKIFYVIALRLFARIADKLVQEHWACGPLVESNLRKFGMKKEIVRYQSPIKEYDIEWKQTKYFIIIYYYPLERDSKFMEWLYGRDICRRIEKYFEDCKDIIFFEINGSSKMDKVYEMTNLYIRPNRHDGEPRMVRECQILGIPVIHSYRDPDFNYFVDQIKEHYDTYRRNKA